MENAATMGTLLHEMGLVLQGLIDSGYSEQFERIIFNTTSDFHINFPENKNFFALFVEDGILKYFPFDDQENAEKALACFKKTGDTTQYRIVPRSVAAMIGREHEYYQYQEAMADSDAEAEEARQNKTTTHRFISEAIKPSRGDLGVINSSMIILSSESQSLPECPGSPLFQ